MLNRAISVLGGIFAQQKHYEKSIDNGKSASVFKRDID